jgi:phage gpG-like protein
LATIDSPIRFEDLSQHIAAMGQALASASAKELWEDELKPIAIEGQMDNFANAQQPDGTPWPLRRNHGDPLLDGGRSGVPGHPLLIDTGELVNSIADQSNSNHVETVLDRLFATGTNIPYAAEHEYGEGQAVRSYIGISDEYIDRMAVKVSEWAIEIIAGVG